MAPRLLPYGDRALLVEVDEVADVVLVADTVRSGPLADLVEDVVPGARTVLLVARPGSLDELANRCQAEIAIVPHERHRDPARPGAFRGGPCRRRSRSR